MYAGMIISYRLTPLPGLTVTWNSEITHVCEPDFFVDEQRLGPYKFWHHQHFFKTVENGTKVSDIVNYAIGYGILGRLLQRFVVSPRLDDIFDYRYEKLERMFGETAAAG
jgi:ligand-binding SRPBCC domain-containing protein